MEKTQFDLWQKIAHFDLDDPHAALTFSQKLMSEQKWSLPQTQRAIAEYKKFMLLVVMGPNGASPSKMVDEVWHLHLTFTKNYQDFCKKVAPQFIHHHPSKGGEAEKDRHSTWYKDTLVAYMRYFDAPPPPDVWEYPYDFQPEGFLPENSQFATPYTEGSLPTENSFEKIRWDNSPKMLALGVICFIAFLYWANPYALSGPNFLRFYAVFAIFGLAFNFFEERKISD